MRAPAAKLSRRKPLPSARPKVRVSKVGVGKVRVGKPAAPAVSFRLRYVTCGSPSCRLCGGDALAHGPYWFQVVRGGGGARYAGKGRPAGVSAATEAAEKLRAEAERAKKARIRGARAQTRARAQQARLESLARRGGLPADDLRRLGLDPGASADDAKRAFRALALECHPDRPGGSHAAMQQLNDAYERIQRGLRAQDGLIDR